MLQGKPSGFFSSDWCFSLRKLDKVTDILYYLYGYIYVSEIRLFFRVC